MMSQILGPLAPSAFSY